MAAGDSWADPIVVDNWDDFLTVSGNSSYYVKFANPDREITGDGSSTNPFIVSTYEEMLLKTGASYIHQVKLIDRDAKKYKYGDIECIYDDSLTTIDFNDIMPNGYSSDLMIYAHVDFNGWTLKNMMFISSYLRFTNRGYNLRLLNLYFTGKINSAWLNMSNGMENMIIDMSGVNPSTSNQTVFATGSSFSYGLTNSSFNLRTTGYITTTNVFLDNCVINFDVGEVPDASLSYINTRDTLMTGKIKTNSTGTTQLFGSLYNCILDFDWTGTTTPSKTSNVQSPSFFNSDKIPSGSMTATNLYAATTEQLKSAQWLYDHGLPIGVD